MALNLRFRVRGSRWSHYFCVSRPRSYHWVNVIGHVSHQKVKICQISVPCYHIITINGSLGFWLWGILGAISFVIEMSWIEANPAKIDYFLAILSWFDLSVTLRWPFYDLWVTPLSSPTRPMSPCVLALGFIIMYLKYWSSVQTWQSLSYLFHVCHMRKWWHKGDLMGYYPSNPYITPSPYINHVTSWGLLVYFHAVVYVSFNHHWHLKWVELKQNQQK